MCEGHGFFSFYSPFLFSDLEKRITIKNRCGFASGELQFQGLVEAVGWGHGISAVCCF